MKNYPFTLNDNDRESWIGNDEGLYRWWKSTGMTVRMFHRTYRADVDAYIHKVLNKEAATE